MRQVIFKKTRTTRQLYKRVPIILTRENGWAGFSSVSDGEEEIYYETSLDWKELDAMARKAAASKSGQSRDGALTVKIVERRRLSNSIPASQPSAPDAPMKGN